MRESEVREKIEAAGGSWEVFLDWMFCQTVGTYENGDTDWYDWDVERFIRYQCNPKNEPLQDFD